MKLKDLSFTKQVNVSIQKLASSPRTVHKQQAEDEVAECGARQLNQTIERARAPEGNPPSVHLASYRRCVERIRSTWPAFARRRGERLQQGLFNAPVEKVAENILEDLFTAVLDWDLTGVNLQVGRADMVLSRLGVKRLVVEVKRPGALAWHRRAVEDALDQARRYADEQKVRSVAISDGRVLYAADIKSGGLKDRLFVALDQAEPPEDLWWVSVQGIWRPRVDSQGTTLGLIPEVQAPEAAPAELPPPGLLNPKYHLPARCFAYVGSAADPRTWKLPYLLADGSPDMKRLPKAVQAIVSDYRGAVVILPRAAVGDVLVRLARIASSLGKMPCQSQAPAQVYVELHDTLDQLGRLSEVDCCPHPSPHQP